MDDPNTVRDRWADRRGAYSPTYYAHHGPDRTSAAIGALLERFVGSDAAVMEVGCSAGRHLAHLHDQGFENLAGIEVNQAAFDVMAETYPSLAAQGTFHSGAIEEIVPELPDDRFDAVFAVETLQHLHPDERWVFGDLARVSDDLIITAEIERGTDTEHRRPGSGDAVDGNHPSHSRVGRPGDEPGDEADASPAGVNFVDDGLPLFYRNWHRIFTGLGLTQIDRTRGERTTIRTFRKQSG